MNKELIDQLKDRKYLKEHSLFIIDTEKVLGEAAAAGCRIEHFLFNEDGEEIYKKHNKAVAGVSERVKTALISQLSEVKTHQGFVAVVKAPENEGVAAGGAVVLLDNIQDPANLGGIIRNGAAFGFKNFLLHDGVYIYGEKTIRASAGNVFHVRSKAVAMDEILALKKNFKFFVTDVDSGVDVREAAGLAKGNYAIVLGNEGQGVTPDIMKLADYRIHIPLAGKDVESLNVAAAAAVIFYNFAEIHKK
jgi:TrmH family RNA methyltransferase